MRRLLPGGLVLAATIVSVTATVDDSLDGGVTSVSVTRNAGDPPTYSIALCEVSPCPVSGTRYVTLGPNTMTIKKSAGAWQWQVEDEDHKVIRGGWNNVPGGWVDKGDGTGSTAILLMGPTASGKSALALAIAARLQVEIVSVDSAQVYRGMDVGTAKPSPAIRARVPHHLLDICEPTETYSAGPSARMRCG